MVFSLAVVHFSLLVFVLVLILVIVFLGHTLLEYLPVVFSHLVVFVFIDILFVAALYLHDLSRQVTFVQL
jgi:hypothetical protein